MNHSINQEEIVIIIKSSKLAEVTEKEKKEPVSASSSCAYKVTDRNPSYQPKMTQKKRCEIIHPSPYFHPPAV
jgi:hypothetical protein